MRRQPISKNLSYSGISQQAPLPPSNFTSSYYFPRPAANIATFSRDNSQHKSKEKPPSNSFQFISYRTETAQTKSSEVINTSGKELLDLKQNTARSNIDREGYTARLKNIEERLNANDLRMETLDKSSTKWEQLRRLVEELMKKQVSEVKAIEEFQERLGSVQQMMTHLKTTKADKRQMQSSDNGNYSALVERINQLSQHNVSLDEEITQVNNKFQKMITKIQASFVTMGQKYEEFIESNIIRSIEHVNKLTHHYRDELEVFKKEQEGLVSKINSMEKEKQIKGEIGTLLLNNFNSGIRIVQTITASDEKKTRLSQLGMKENRREQLLLTAESPKMQTYSENILNNLYDSIDKPKTTSNPLPEILIDRIIYKLDSDYNLLDDHDQYILDAKSRHIRLGQTHIALLREHGLV